MNIIQKPANPRNYTVGRVSKVITHVVIHIEQGYEGDDKSGTIAWFANAASHVSAHYSIRKDGQVFQHVKESDTAWHAGIPYPYTWADPTKQPLKGFGSQNPNAFSIGIEHEGFPVDIWPDAQVDASAALVADICKRYNITCDRQHVVRHSEVFAGHACPGNNGPIDEIVKRAVVILNA